MYHFGREGKNPSKFRMFLIFQKSSPPFETQVERIIRNMHARKPKFSICETNARTYEYLLQQLYTSYAKKQNKKKRKKNKTTTNVIK